MKWMALGLIFVGLAVAVAACGGGGDNGDGNGGGTPAVTGEGTNHVLGSAQAPVLIVEYADFQ